MSLRPLEKVLFLQCEDHLKSSESDVYRRQILTTKVNPRTVRFKGLTNDHKFYQDQKIFLAVSDLIIFIIAKLVA